MQLQSQGNSWTPGEQLDIEEQLGSWTAAGQNSWTEQSANCGTPRNSCRSREQDKFLIIEDHDDDLQEKLDMEERMAIRK